MAYFLGSPFIQAVVNYIRNRHLLLISPENWCRFYRHTDGIYRANLTEDLVRCAFYLKILSNYQNHMTGSVRDRAMLGGIHENEIT